MRYEKIAKKPVKEDVAKPALKIVQGPIFGVPIEEMKAWEDSLDTDSPLPEPQPRRLE